MTISQLLYEMANFRSGLRGAALLLRSGPKVKVQLQTYLSQPQGKPKGYFSTSFFAMSVDGMYQGCIMRNIRTWEASFNVPDSSECKEQKSCKTTCHLGRI